MCYSQLFIWAICAKLWGDVLAIYFPSWLKIKVFIKYHSICDSILSFNICILNVHSLPDMCYLALQSKIVEIVHGELLSKGIRDK